ncbi:hypothetical protein NEIPOLOT_02205, partial [Neisseria polysaccharea ATCC 43768]
DPVQNAGRYQKDVSTHSRLKAAERFAARQLQRCFVSTHSRLKAAETVQKPAPPKEKVSTHSRLKAADSPVSVIQR